MTDLDPDKLLKMLDAELMLKRSRLAPARGNRTAFRVASIGCLLLVLLVALFALQYFAAELSTHPAPAAAQQSQP